MNNISFGSLIILFILFILSSLEQVLHYIKNFCLSNVTVEHMQQRSSELLLLLGFNGFSAENASGSHELKLPITHAHSSYSACQA